MEAANGGIQSPEEFLTAESDVHEGTMTMMTMNVSAMYSEQKAGDRTTAVHEAHKGLQPGAIVTATVVRTALVGVSIYQSKALRQCASISFLLLILLLLWLFTWLATTKAGRTTTTTASAETSIVAFDTTHAPPNSEAANRTVLLDGFEALSLLNDMTVPNHVLDIDSFPE